MCLTDSIVQCYIDEELGEAMSATLGHIETCSRCSLAVDEAMTEQYIVRSALAHEMELPVPTERLRARIDRVIREFEPAVGIDIWR